MAYRTLDLTLVSARDLKNVNLISKLQAFAILSLKDGNHGMQFEQTPVDRRGNKNPTWNYTARFFIPADGNAVDVGNLSIHILVRANRMLGDWNIGEIYIPLKSLMPYGGSNGTKAAYFASYQIRKAGSRKPRGIINISYKLREPMETPPMSQTHEPVKLHEQLAIPPMSQLQEPVKQWEQLATPPMSQLQEPVKQQERLATPPMSQLQEPVRTYPPPRPIYAHPYAAPRPPPVYGYPEQQPMQHGMSNQNNFGMGLGAGLLGGALGGLLIGDMISDVGAYDAGYDAGAYDAGYDAGFDDARYDAGFDDAGGFDGGYDF
ncbi:hypothetical protein LUZ61_003616 [Rhynchospora tenuis]|uniref:C2 domain-containing protein n=1 Tax=Rhynchospora tenuis TaxID=198213 RepID=A0AAD6ESY2_9POAL|nr:hypothetical protein LUZ61_003616 [Rhynchospora tenuis]